MAYNKELIAGKLMRWDAYLIKFRLPAWKDIPNIGLYMEQVTALLKDYLDYLPPELKEEQFITPATINNYVRKKIMPEPIKKKYYRKHIAYLIIICTLKYCLSISTLQTMIPMGLSDEEVERVYTSYADCHRIASTYFSGQVKAAASGILGIQAKSELTTDSTEEIIAAAAVISGLSRLLAEKLLLLNNRTLADGGPVASRAAEDTNAEKPNE